MNMNGEVVPGWRDAKRQLALPSSCSRIYFVMRAASHHRAKSVGLRKVDGEATVAGHTQPIVLAHFVTLDFRKLELCGFHAVLLGLFSLLWC